MPESNKSIKTENYLQRDFPLHHYKGKNLTQEQVNYRIKVICVNSFIYLPLIFTLVLITTD